MYLHCHLHYPRAAMVPHRLGKHGFLIPNSKLLEQTLTVTLHTF